MKCEEKAKWNEIDELYNLYHFNRGSSGNGFTVYLYEEGYFNNAEIVYEKNTDELEIERITNEYQDTGYAVKKTAYSSIDEVKESLFRGFFKIQQSNNKSKNEYISFCNSQTSKLGGFKYEYIRSEYTFDGSKRFGDILEDICKIFTSKGRQLIILEAPAGFGKTCTSYEILNKIASQESKNVPILAELSKNRRASIFQYVLLSEIDHKFSNLQSDLVINQIREGRVPLIIDGFDELLSQKKQDVDDNESSNAESMLDTIADLLGDSGNAKILLTSRKSSIFSGELFDRWLEGKLNDCSITRIQIMQPTIRNWIDADKLEYFSSSGIDLNTVINPVLLSLIKSLSLEECKELFHSASDVLEKYLESMFTREKERQVLNLTSEEQRFIMQKLASNMVKLDISSASQEDMSSLIEMSVEENLGYYMKKNKEVQTEDGVHGDSVEAFLNKLTHNALLDRLGTTGNNIGFVNEFIFGVFIGESVINGMIEPQSFQEKYLHFAITAFQSETKQNKELLYNWIIENNLTLNTQMKLAIDFNLKGMLTFDYVDEYISNEVFEKSFNFNSGKYLYNCIFDSCTFSGIHIGDYVFVGCQFINCNFYDVSVDVSGTLDESSIFIACTGADEIEKSFTIETKQDEKMDTDLDFEKRVLENFWMPGIELADIRKAPRTLYKGFDPKMHKQVSMAIQRLRNKGYIIERIYCYELNKTKMNEIRDILERD